MKKIFLNVLIAIIFTQGVIAQTLISNSDITFEVAERSVQRHNESYKFYMVYKHKTPLNQISESAMRSSGNVMSVFIHKENVTHRWLGGESPYLSRFNFSDFTSKEVVNGYDVFTYRKLINLNDINFDGSNFPFGNFYFSIAAYIGSGRHAVIFENGRIVSGGTNDRKLFNINDICTNCNNGIFIDTDSDGDGVYDNEDECPNEAGKKANNGCPGDPDLVIDERKSTVIISNTSLSTGTVSILYNTIFPIHIDDELQIYLKTDNKGKIASGKTKVGFYISTTNKIKDAGLIKEISLANINPNKSQSRSVSFSQWDLSSTYGIIGNAYLHIKLDNNNDIYEGSDGENNNEFSSIKLNIRNTHRRSKGKIKLISIRNINGQLIRNNVLIENKQEEIDLIKSLSRGLYFMDKNGKKSQLYKN